MKIVEEYKAIVERCILLFQEYIQKVIDRDEEINNMYSELQAGREEFGIQTDCTLERGFYCPNPTVGHFVTNVHRGKIAKRITKVTRLTNRYVFDKKDTLRIVERYYPNGHIKPEFVFHEWDASYSVTFDDADRPEVITIYRQENGKPQEYLWAYCTYDKNKKTYTTNWMSYQTYDYSKEGYLEMEHYEISVNQKVGAAEYGRWIPKDNLIQYYKNRFQLNDDGSIVPKSCEGLMHNVISWDN